MIREKKSDAIFTCSGVNNGMMLAAIDQVENKHEQEREARANNNNLKLRIQPALVKSETSVIIKNK